MLAGSAAVLLLAAGIGLASLKPSQLKARGQQAATAWLANDADGIKPFVDPTQVEMVARWMKVNPPPKLADQKPPPSVSVAVHRNDGATAEVVIQIKAKKANGTPAFFVYRHRWVSRQGVWYVQPNLPTTHASIRSGFPTGS